jgi:hypothetical protein
VSADITSIADSPKPPIATVSPGRTASTAAGSGYGEPISRSGRVVSSPAV